MSDGKRCFIASTYISSRLLVTNVMYDKFIVTVIIVYEPCDDRERERESSGSGPE